MNKLLLSMAFLILMGITLMGQTRISGIVKDATTEKEIYDLKVLLVETGEEVKTDRIGYFQFVDVAEGAYTIRISGVGYETLEKNLTVSDQKNVDLGNVAVKFNPTSVNVGLVTLTVDDLDGDESSSQSAVGLLQSSQDVFASTAAFELGAYWFKVRGYDNKYNEVFFNGVRMNKTTNDRVNFGNWGGLNDVTRRPAEQTLGIEPSDYAFGDIGGVTYFDTRPSQMRKGTSLAYSFTNRSYNQRVLATYNTGLMENGWGFMGSFSRRWAEEGRVEGTFYDSWGYFLGVEKKINDKHTINFTGFGAPTRRSTNSPNTQEAYDLRGNDYNSYWGWQDGEKRSERIREFHEPVLMMTHHWNINKNTKLTTTASYMFGKDSRSRLDWYDAKNPTPTYYKNMPSYWETEETLNPEEIQNTYNAWANDPKRYQIDWDNIYLQNYTRNEVGEGAAYVLAADVIEDKTMSFYTNLKGKIASNIDFIAVASYQNTQSEYYKEVLDLLGANHYVNHNAFQGNYYNVDESRDRKVGEGDKYQYNYELNHQIADIFFQSVVKLDKLDITFGARASYTSMYRDGKYRNELYLNNSKGKSETYDFYNFGAKTQFLYKLDGRNFIQLNGEYATFAPTADEVFPNARTNDFTVDKLENTKVLSGDLSYILRAPRIKGRATAFYTKFMDEYERSFGYIDVTSGTAGDANVFTSEVLAGVDKLHIGAEVALEAQLTTTLTLSAVASIGQFTYENSPDYYQFSDSDALLDFGGRKNYGKAYLEDYKIAVGPQQGYSLGLEYRAPQYWWLGVTGNYLAQNYMDIAMYKRTQGFISDPTNPGFLFPNVNEETLRTLLKQNKFTDEFMLNVNAGKSFRFGQYNMGISLTVNNVLNNKNYVTSGFEQMRVGNYVEAQQEQSQRRFAPRMWYDQGISYFLNVYFRF
ncbi:carboxypeptidase-like regulatory domain-containing protein [Moheibacter sediminis]|uniref:CarboxypepD_reg-like domain-containing protein n=1 Tax=Moheibacter sediminis TaxID=1434700 RepID=A0A1W1Y9M0_9FLAO|nr:carboxypeptidase-like regulatory domain-containing protein [Moheibacter sediminis]SMC32829.1 CarboxypepD_reg-like domain-containing protein [Moheibacter sediminis]